MLSSKNLGVFILVLAISATAAGRQLAMLIEVTPQMVVEDGTLTEVVVRVAPEDRPALGDDVMLWVELTRKEVRVFRKGWALKIDDPNEPIAAKIVIPDGPHVLRVDLKGPGGRSTGVWWGDVDVANPASGSASASGSDPEDSDSDQQQQSAPAPGTAAASETGPASDQAPSPEPQASESASDPVPVPDDSNREQQQQAATGTATAATAEAASAPESVPETVGGASMPRDPDAEGMRAVNDPPTDPGELDPDPDPVPDPDPDDSDSQQRQRAAAATGAATAAVPDSTPIESGEVSTECFPPQTSDLPGRDELTVMVTRNGAPVSGLTVDQFVVTAGGETIPVSRVEGPGEGVTNLRIAIDLDAATLADMSWIDGLVERLAKMVHPPPGADIIGDLAGRFSCPIRFDPANTGSLGWMFDARKGSPQQDLPHLILASLESASATRGKSFLVIVTDGRGPRNPKAWKGVYEAAAKAGVPVFIAGIWREDFGSGLRKNLRKLAAVSGGAVFYVPGPSQVDDLIERFGAEFHGAYSVVVESLEIDGKIEVDLVGVDAKVRTATSIRWNKPLYDFEGDRIRGMFVYFADVAQFIDCNTGDRLPVAMEADYLAAERAYLEARSEPMAPVLMTIEARIAERPPMEGDGLIYMVIIDRFIAVHPGKECE